jgi:phosphopantetheinyl transferase
MKELDTSQIRNYPQDVIIGEADIEEHISLDILSKEELKEHDTFKNRKRRAEFVSARKLFRFLLCQMDINPKQVLLQKDQEGKPYAAWNGKHIFVSFSHSPEKVYCAISKKLDIGLDVEPVSRKISQSVLKRITTDAERSVVSTLKPVQVWTIKEAVVKFLGTGLRTNLNELKIVKNQSSQISVKFYNDKYIEICSFRQSDHQIALAYQSKHI